MRELARKSQLAQPAISYIERGLRIPSLDTVYRIAVALDLDLSRVIREAQRSNVAARRRNRGKQTGP